MNIALIGNAQSLFNKRLGDEIDSYDKVYRINRGCKIIDSKHQGNKLDFAFMSVPKIFKDIVPSITVPIMHVSRFSRPTTIKEVTYMPMNSITNCRKLLDHDRPSCGMMVINWLLESTKDTIHLYGFDFKETPSFYCSHIGPHNFEKEKQLILKLSNENSRLQLHI